MKQYLEKEQAKFDQYLKKNDLRLTLGRKEIFEQVMNTHGHFTAEQLVKECTVQGRNASRATVYRVLRELLEAGVIRETAYGQKHQNFEHVYDEKLHHHARCIRCGEMLELPDMGEEKNYQPILKDQGFQILGHELSFYGICAKCA